jgi:hypothetical protein
MSTYLLWDDKNDVLLKFSYKSSEIATSCLGRNVNNMKIFIDGKMLPRPYETDVSKLQKQIEIGLDYNSYHLEDDLFDV